MIFAVLYVICQIFPFYFDFNKYNTGITYNVRAKNKEDAEEILSLCYKKWFKEQSKKCTKASSLANVCSNRKQETLIMYWV